MSGLSPNCRVCGAFALSRKDQPQADTQEQPKLTAAQLLAALGYLVDVTPGGCYYHAWRVALVSQRIAAAIAPDVQRDIFYAGLLHDAGAVGASKHITRYILMRDQIEDVNVRTHTQRGAALLNWLPGMSAAAQFVATHHEWWDGRGYPDGRVGTMTPLGGFILGIATTADIVGCFRSVSNLRSSLSSIATMTGHVWPKEVWSALVRSMEDAEFYKTIADPSLLPAAISQKLKELPVPEELDNEKGAERTLHLFAALVDLKDPSTAGHSLRTARRAKALAEHMGYSEADAHTAYQAGLVHDCGRLGVDTHTLNKAGRLSEKEMSDVRKHAQMTIEALSCLPDAPGMAALGNIAGHDHERYDGTGYPDGLAGEEIPPISRILSVVDAYDSMVASSNYRFLTPKGAVVRILQGAGKQFDPQVAEAMAEMVKDENIETKLKAA